MSRRHSVAYKIIGVVTTFTAFGLLGWLTWASTWAHVGGAFLLGCTAVHVAKQMGKPLWSDWDGPDATDMGFAVYTATLLLAW